MVPSKLQSIDLEEAIAAAVRAPSVLNTQPWLFVAGDDVIELRADLRRALPALDPLGRALTISCGAALLGLRLAVMHQRREPVVRMFPHADDPELLAELRIGGPRLVPNDVAAADEELYSALPRRHTNRQPLRAGRPDDAVLDALATAAAVEGAHLDVLDGIDTRNVVDVLHDADRAQRLDPAVRAEVARWTHRPDDADDGLRDADLGPRASRPLRRRPRLRVRRLRGRADDQPIRAGPIAGSAVDAQGHPRRLVARRAGPPSRTARGHGSRPALLAPHPAAGTARTARAASATPLGRRCAAGAAPPRVRTGRARIPPPTSQRGAKTPSSPNPTSPTRQRVTRGGDRRRRTVPPSASSLMRTHRPRILASASGAVSSASGRECRYFSVVAMLAWPSRSLTT